MSIEETRSLENDMATVRKTLENGLISNIIAPDSWKKMGDALIDGIITNGEEEADLSKTAQQDLKALTEAFRARDLLLVCALALRRNEVPQPTQIRELIDFCASSRIKDSGGDKGTPETHLSLAELYAAHVQELRALAGPGHESRAPTKHQTRFS